VAPTEQTYLAETGRRYFSNAELVVHENEPPHWFDDDAMAKASERQRRLYFMCAREQIAPYKDRTRLFQKGEVFPGVTAIPCHGHTPGHTSFLISSGNEQLLIWGDTVHVPEIQTARQEVCMEFDTDPVAAAVTRRRWRPTGWRSPACTCTFPGSLISCAAARAISSFPKRGSKRCNARMLTSYFSTWSAADSRANKPDAPKTPVRARSRTD
jgi:Metallo-beta-lactamase superfamily